jgi:hypothetical protein
MCCPGTQTMSVSRTPSHNARLPVPVNDNEPPRGPLVAKVLVPKDLPITQMEIEVFSALLDDWTSTAANDNEDPSK